MVRFGGQLNRFGSMALTRPLVGSILLLSAVAAEGEPIVRLAWVNCGGAGTVYDYVTREGGPSGRLQAWVLGQEAGSKGYSIELELWSPTGMELADAWRFDAGGCQPESLLIINVRTLQPTGQTCGPGLCEPMNVTSLTLGNEYDSSLRKTRIRVDVLYPPGSSSANPFVRYRLAEFIFSHSLSRFGNTTVPETCGGFEQAVCFRVINARYLNTADEWVPWVIDGTQVTAHGEGTPVPECSIVSARPSTWGAIKDTYR